MRPRKEIEEDFQIPRRSLADLTVFTAALSLEVLLDIRDLLQPISNEASLHLQAKQVVRRPHDAS